jgi:type IV pilus assembly protein PilB
MNEKIIKTLLEEAIINKEQLARAQEEQQRSGNSLESILAKWGVTEEKIIKILSERFRVPMVDWSHIEINPEVLNILPEEKARKYTVFPLTIERMERRQSKITLAMADPSDLATINEIDFLTGCSVKPFIASESSILHAIKQYYRTGEDKIDGRKQKIESFEETEMDGQIPSGEEKASPIKGIEELRILGKDFTASIEYTEEREETISTGTETQADRWLNQILIQALKKGASEIHLDPYEKGLIARYRVETLLSNVGETPPGSKKAVISSLKQRGQITVPTDKMLYQGDITLSLDSRRVEFLISICPSFYGEKVVLKPKTKALDLLELTQLGFGENTLKMYLKLLDVPDGLILITSPPGGGKTTTFYSTLQYLNKPHLNIITLESFVSCTLPGINQGYLENPETTRKKALQVLEYNPDVVGISEILNKEEAQTTLDLSAQTLVLTALTAFDSSSALLRLFSLMEPRSDQERDLILDSINCITAQRLVRQICPTCKDEYTTSPEDRDSLAQLGLFEKGVGEVFLYKGKGCKECDQTGYKGLTAFFEIMRVTREIRDLVFKEPLAANLKKALQDLKLTTLEKSALKKLRTGITTLEEVKRVMAL